MGILCYKKNEKHDAKVAVNLEVCSLIASDSLIIIISIDSGCCDCSCRM